MQAHPLVVQPYLEAVELVEAFDLPHSLIGANRSGIKQASAPNEMVAHETLRESTW